MIIKRLLDFCKLYLTYLAVCKLRKICLSIAMAQIENDAVSSGFICPGDEVELRSNYSLLTSSLGSMPLDRE